MAIAFRALTSLNYGSGHASPTVFTAPAGLADGDILIALVDCGSNSGGGTVNDITPPAGFTAINPAVEVTQGGVYVKHHVFWKRALSESGSYSFAHDAGATRSTGGALAAYSGVPAMANPIDSDVTVNSGNGVTATALGITTSAANAHRIIAAHNFDANAISTPAGYSNRFAQISVLSDGVQAVAGASGDKTFTSGSVGSNPWQAWHFALRLAPPTGGWVTKPVKVWTG